MQGRPTSWLIAGFILFFGLLGALPFHNDPPPRNAHETDGPGAVDDLVWQDVVSAPAFAAPQVDPPSFGESRFAADPQVAPVTAITALTPLAKEPPAMPEQYGSLLSDYERRLGDSARAPSQPVPMPDATARLPVNALTGAPSSDEEDAAHEPRQFAPPIVRSLPRAESPPSAAIVARRPPIDAPRVEPQRHKIRDGDTLSSLAERYLGDARRAVEIFEANREVLTDPDLLPLGKYLTIPQLRELPPLAPRSEPELRRLPPTR